MTAGQPPRSPWAVHWSRRLWGMPSASMASVSIHELYIVLSLTTASGTPSLSVEVTISVERECQIDTFYHDKLTFKVVIHGSPELIEAAPLGLAVRDHV